MAKDKLRLEQIVHQQQQERELFNTGPVLTFIWQPKRPGNVLQVSKNVTEILGYTPEEMTSPAFTYDEIVHPEDLEKARSESAKYREKGMRRYHQSYRLKTKSGSYRWFFDQTQCIEDAGGTIIEHRGYLVDQTPLKEAEANLEKERRRLADIIEATQVGTWERNVQTNEVLVNQRWAEILGFELSELEPMTLATWVDLVHPDDLQAAEREAFSVYHQNKQYYSVECRMKHKNGHWVWVHAKGKVISWTEDAQPLLMSGTITDITERKQTEETLQESLTRYDELAANVPVGVYVFWIRGNGQLEFEYVSDRWCEINQLKREDVLADVMKANNLVHPDERDEFMLRNQECFRHRIPFVWEGRFFIGDGRLRCLRIESTPIVFDNGDIRWFGITEDITERKQAEELLQDKEEQFRAMFEKHHAVMLLIDPESGKIIGANQRAEKYYGYKAAEFENMTIQQINQLDNDEIAWEMSNAKAQKRNYFNFLHRLATGEIRNVEVHSSPIPFKGKTILFSIIHDVTDRKQAEEALTLQSNLLEDSQALANLGSWEWDILDDTWNFSEQWKIIHGLSVDDLPTSKLFEIAHPEDVPFIEKAFTAAKEQRKTYDIEHRIIRADNKEIRYIKALGKVEFDQDTGRPVRMVGASQDISDRKQAEAALKLATQQAEVANQAKSRYLAHMNHEMRTPLNGFMGFISLMETTGLNEEQQAYMHHMKQSATHLLSIINNVLDMAKIEAGKICLESQIFNLEEEIGTAMAPLRSVASQKDIHLLVTMDNNLPIQVKGDPQRLRQIILNLGSNGVKFTEKGQVHIAIGCPDTTQDHHILHLVVEDTGSGMTGETLKNLFQPFYQADDGSVPQAKGTGLGLTITKELVELMGGTIQMASTPGKGTRVEVTLELNKVEWGH